MSIAVSAVMIIFTAFVGVIGGEVTLDGPIVVVYPGMVISNPAWSIAGFIVVPDFDTEENIRHEWGHYSQEREIGFDRYVWTIAIPSLLTAAFHNSKEMPWEIDADRRAKGIDTNGRQHPADVPSQE